MNTNLGEVKMSEIVKYRDVRSRLKSFDYLNCVDRITLNPKTWFWHLIGHTARVFVDRRTGVVSVYESTTLNKNGGSGVQLTLMSDWIAARRHSHVMWRPVRFGNNIFRIQAERRFGHHIYFYRGTPYPDLSQWRWRWHMANAAIDLPGDQPQLENADQDEMMHCTQLSFHLDRFCRLIERPVNPAESEPDNCRPGRQDWLGGLLVDGVTVGDEIEIVA